jgi:hypothetical protein
MADGYVPLRLPFANMSFTPDVPSNALAPNEYNNGYNIETDVRGIKKVDGEQSILSAITGNVIFIIGGFRNSSVWCYIVATTAGSWYLVETSGISNITPTASAYSGAYTANTIITGSWVGQVFFLNDDINPPMYFTQTANVIGLFDSPDPVTSQTYVWNYESTITPAVTKVTAGFVRNFCSPNVGNILIAGNLVKTIGGVNYQYPTTVRWSQSFANTGVPATWTPTITNVANEQEVPLRGPIVDGFFLGGNFYVCSYWDTVIFSPIAYQTYAAPIFGISLFKQGRGLLNVNCWDNADDIVYGVDSRDIWAFDGTNFTNLGNQRIKNYFYKNLNPSYTNRVHLVNNTHKYQIEIYYPSLNSTGYCDQMISYRYDLKIWNPPKTINNSAMAIESPVYTSGSFNLSSRTTVYAPNTGSGSCTLVQTGQGTSFSGNAISTLFERDNMTLLDEQGQPITYPHKLYVHRLFPEVTTTTPSVNPQITITLGGASSVGQPPFFGDPEVVNIVTSDPWVTTTQNDVRTVALKISSTDTNSTWNMSAMTFLSTIVEDAF